MLADVAKIVDLLGGEENLGQRVSSQEDLTELTTIGIPIAAFLTFSAIMAEDLSAETKDQITRTVFCDDVPNEQNLMGLEASSRLVRLANLVAVAIAIIGNFRGAREFLLRPHRELSGAIPFELTKSGPGSLRAEEVLARAALGMPV